MVKEFKSFSDNVYFYVSCEGTAKDLKSKYDSNLQHRLLKFATNTIVFLGTLPEKREYSVFITQLSRCGTSIGANFEEACGSISRKEFISKLGICLKESRECYYWLKILQELKLGDSTLRSHLYQESIELLKIFITSLKTAKTRKL
jgi:four helix bundle protein